MFHAPPPLEVFASGETRGIVERREVGLRALRHGTGGWGTGGLPEVLSHRGSGFRLDLPWRSSHPALGTLRAGFALGTRVATLASMNGLYEAVQAMSAAERRLDTVATNLANVGVNGYKRRGTTTQSFDSMLRGQMVRQIETHTVRDHGQGVLEATGNEYDLALAGAGFFAVETPSGEAYTRNGKFHIDDEGVLLTTEGEQVAWEGSRGRIDPRLEVPTIDPEGIVYQGELRIGQLKITNFDRPSDLIQQGGGNYRASRGQRETTHTAQVRQGSLERSNVSPVDEMVSMIAVQRSFESSARAMSMIDQTYRRLLSAR